MFRNNKSGFTLIETLVVVGIIAIMASIILVALTGARAKARDAKRKTEIAGIGRLVTGSCFLPSAGPGEYDIADVVTEYVAANPQYARYVSVVPKDPSADSSGTHSLYMYTVSDDGKCAVYANLENDGEPVTLPSISVQTAGGGTGVFQATTDGWNGSTKYFQVSK